jgi:hypothetical protein
MGQPNRSHAIQPEFQQFLHDENAALAGKVGKSCAATNLDAAIIAIKL